LLRPYFYYGHKIVEVNAGPATFSERGEIGVAARDGLEGERAEALVVELAEIVEQLRAILDVKEVEPALEDEAEPVRPVGLVPKIDDVERRAALDVDQAASTACGQVGIMERE